MPVSAGIPTPRRSSLRAPSVLAAFGIALLASVASAAMSAAYVRAVQTSFANDPPPPPAETPQPLPGESPPPHDPTRLASADRNRAKLPETGPAVKIPVVENKGEGNPKPPDVLRKTVEPIVPDPPRRISPVPRQAEPNPFPGGEGDLLVLVLATKELLVGSPGHSTLVGELKEPTQAHSGRMAGGEAWVATKRGVERWSAFLRSLERDGGREDDCFAGTEFPAACDRARELLAEARRRRGAVRPIVVWNSPYVPRPKDVEKSTDPVPAVLVWVGVPSAVQSMRPYVTDLFETWFPHGDQPENLGETLRGAIDHVSNADANAK